jgi:hypothetical protein
MGVLQYLHPLFFEVNGTGSRQHWLAGSGPVAPANENSPCAFAICGAPGLQDRFGVVAHGSVIVADTISSRSVRDREEPTATGGKR